MKIQANNIDDFIAKINNSLLKGVVIYGPDSGLITIRKNEILQKIIPDYKSSLSLINLNMAIIKEKPEIIDYEYNSLSLFGNDRKVILIEEADNTISKILDEIFNKIQNSNNFIVITADDLDNKSSLRKFAENSEYFMAIPCYKDDINTIMQLVNKKLKKEGFTYNQEVLKTLSESFGGDRLIILNELEKLIIYKDNDKNITIDDVYACIQDNSEATIEELIASIANLDYQNAFKELQSLYSIGVFPIAIIRSLIYYFLRLQLYKFQLQNGINFEEITVRDKIFWKQKPIIVQHLKKLTSRNINSILLFLMKEECKLKGKIEYN